MAATSLNKTTAAIIAGTLCILIGNVLNHADIASIPDGWSRWLIEALKQSDSMSEVQTLVTTLIVYFTRNQTANS